MTIKDPTLDKVRLLMQMDEELLEETSTPYNEFVKQVQAYYKKQGVNVSYDLTYKIIDALGVEYAKTKTGASLAEKAKKNPDKLLSVIMDEKGVTLDVVKDLINREKNPTDNAELKAQLDKVIELMASAESHASGQHSIAGVTSSDIYEIKEYLRKILERDSSGQSGGGGSSFTYTGKVVRFIKEDMTAAEGTVLIDSDDSNLSQEYIDAMLKKHNDDTALPKTLAEVRTVPNNLWVKSENRIYSFNKEFLVSEKEHKTIQSLMRKPDVFFRAAAEIKGSDKYKKKFARAQGGFSYHAQKADEIGSEMGFSKIPRL